MPTRQEELAAAYERGRIDAVLRVARRRFWPTVPVEDLAAAAGVSHAALAEALRELRRRTPPPPAAPVRARPAGTRRVSRERTPQPTSPPPDASGGWKWCPVDAGHWEARAGFTKNRARPDGLADLCRSHWNDYVAERRQKTSA